jgi:hypothetical protein
MRCSTRSPFRIRQAPAASARGEQPWQRLCEVIFLGGEMALFRAVRGRCWRSLSPPSEARTHRERKRTVSLGGIAYCQMCLTELGRRERLNTRGRNRGQGHLEKDFASATCCAANRRAGGVSLPVVQWSQKPVCRHSAFSYPWSHRDAYASRSPGHSVPSFVKPH